MNKKRIISLLLASAICATFIGCGKKDEASKVPEIKNNVTTTDKQNTNADSQKNAAKSIKTLNNKQEVLAFSKDAISKVEAIFKNNNVEYALTNDYRYIAYNGTYEKLGQHYDVEISAFFDPFYTDDTESSIDLSYRIPLSGNTDLTKVSIPQLNVILDGMLQFDDKIKQNFKTREELLKQLNKELHDESGDNGYFEFSRSNIKAEDKCKILSGGILVAKAMVKGNIKENAAEYTFDKYDDYISIVEKSNNAITSAMKNAGLKDVVNEYFEKIPCGKTGVEVDGSQESYLCGMESNEAKDSFNITYRLEGSNIPLDMENNTIKDTKYIKALADALNNNEYFKNKFTYEELINEIYNRTKFSINGIEKVVPSSTIPGIDKFEVYVNKSEGYMNFKITFISPATVEGQTAR